MLMVFIYLQTIDSFHCICCLNAFDTERFNMLDVASIPKNACAMSFENGEWVFNCDYKAEHGYGLERYIDDGLFACDNYAIYTVETGEWVSGEGLVYGLANKIRREHNKEFLTIKNNN